MSETEKILLAATIAHLLEHIDTGEPLDYRAAISTLRQSGLVEWAENNAVMIPLRRDNQPQAERFKE